MIDGVVAFSQFAETAEKVFKAQIRAHAFVEWILVKDHSDFFIDVEKPADRALLHHSPKPAATSRVSLANSDSECDSL